MKNCWLNLKRNTRVVLLNSIKVLPSILLLQKIQSILFVQEFPREKYRNQNIRTPGYVTLPPFVDGRNPAETTVCAGLIFKKTICL